jgi:hypothetical protein
MTVDAVTRMTQRVATMDVTAPVLMANLISVAIRSSVFCTPVRTRRSSTTIETAMTISATAALPRPTVVTHYFFFGLAIEMKTPRDAHNQVAEQYKSTQHKPR